MVCTDQMREECRRMFDKLEHKTMETDELKIKMERILAKQEQQELSMKELKQQQAEDMKEMKDSMQGIRKDLKEFINSNNISMQGIFKQVITLVIGAITTYVMLKIKGG